MVCQIRSVLPSEAARGTSIRMPGHGEFGVRLPLDR